MKTLWNDKFRPNTLDEYVWVDPDMRITVEKWLKEGALPHVLLSGPPGTGKTSLSKLLLKLLDIPSADILTVNASRERRIDDFQDKVINFIDSWALGPTGLKYVLLDEADKMSPLTQGLLRSEIETYSDCCRWIMTCNSPGKIIRPLHSRFHELRFPTLDHSDFVMRLADILDSEHISFEPEVLLAYVDLSYPDLRKCINFMEHAVRDGKLPPTKVENFGTDAMVQMVELFSQGKYLEGRKFIIGRIRPDEYDDFYRILYQNLPLFGKTQDQQDQALLIIRNGILNNGVIADPEINASATLVELTQLSRT